MRKNTGKNPNKPLIQKLINTLQLDSRIYNQKSKLNQILLFDLIKKHDEKIINLLFEEKDLRKKFFVKVKESYVFKTEEFCFFIEENQINNSYTKYKNIIGLTDGKRFLKDTNDIVLNWPYKDCILEGGQSSEEGTDITFEYSSQSGQYEHKATKRKEVFFNQVLAHHEIDRLLDPKVLINWKRHTKNGEKEVTEIKRDLDGNIKENLIIKGNNLLALHSIKKQFAGKVKLIYIDPPYNTGNDSFKYNDQFNHSTWLTFMKNRLEVAKEFLRQDGVIAISCDDNEQAYLKVLLDEIFFRDNYIVNFIWQTKKGAQGIVTQNRVVHNHENILIYAKDSKQFKFQGLERDSKEFVNPDNDPKGSWKRQYLQRFGQGFPTRTIINPANGMKFSFETPYTLEKMNQWIKEGAIIFPKDPKQYPARKEYLADYKHKKQLVSSLGLFSTKASTEELYRLFNNEKIFKNPKPENLLAFLIEQTTQENDLVMDYHLGSGTTVAVAHKLKRQYIGIEQMDYIQSIVVERLKKVIAGESNGISKSANPINGSKTRDGEFIYFELAQWNEAAQQKILACSSFKKLKDFFDEMYEQYYLNYNLKLKTFQEKILQEEEFKNLPLIEQKKIFIAMLDNNQIYINLTEMEDKKFAAKKADQKWTEEFYR